MPRDAAAGPPPPAAVAGTAAARRAATSTCRLPNSLGVCPARGRPSSQDVAAYKELLAAKVKEIADDKAYLDALERATATNSKRVSRGFLQMGVSAALEELECALEGWFPVASANVTAEGGADLWSSTIRRPGPPYPCV